ncbi:hypothetical protein Tco_0928464, partial [Tanacetum coccineum]
REVKRLKRSRIPLVKVRWNSKRGPEFMWEREDQFRKKYPYLFIKTASASAEAFETAKYGKIWYDEDIHDLRSVETEFPTISFNDNVSSKALYCEPTVSSLNNKIDFRISFEDSDDEDYTVIFEKNLLSYKKISTNDLKTDSENNNEKVMPSLPSPEPAISCFDDLDFFKDFENEFPTIVYNDALTSKSDLLTEPTLNPQHVDELDLKNKTLLSKYDEEEQNILYFNDLFPFNVFHPNDLKSDGDNDNNEIDIIQSSEEMAPLPPREQRHPFLRYQGLEYSDADIADFEERLERIYNREIHRVQVVDFQGMPELMRDGFFTRMVMEHRDDAGVVVFTSQAWGRLFDTRGPLVWELILEFFSMLRFGEVLLDLDASDTIQF